MSDIVTVAPVRLAKATAPQLLICLEYGVWGATRNRLQKWTVGSQLVIIGSTDLIALADVCGEPFISEDLIFNGGFYPFRIPVSFKRVIGPEQTPAVVADIRKILADRYGKKSGWPILGQVALPDEIGRLVLTAIHSRRNIITEVARDLGRSLEAALAKSESR
jgi:hypothetical protein